MSYSAFVSCVYACSGLVGWVSRSVLPIRHFSRWWIVDAVLCCWMLRMHHFPGWIYCVCLRLRVLCTPERLLRVRGFFLSLACALMSTLIISSFHVISPFHRFLVSSFHRSSISASQHLIVRGSSSQLIGRSKVRLGAELSSV